MCEKGFGFEIDTEPPPSFCINTLLHTLYDERALICLQLWDAVEGSLRCSNDDGVSGITALAFLNNRLNTQKHTHGLNSASSGTGLIFGFWCQIHF